MTTLITVDMLRERVRKHRENHPDRPFTTIEKILIAAEIVKRESRPRKGRNVPMNDADLIHACFSLFPDYDGRDQDLYLRGKVSGTIPMVRPTLIRDHLFGRTAPLKRWMTNDPKSQSYLLTASGSIYVHKLLLSERRRKKRTPKPVAVPPPAPVEMKRPPTLEELRVIQYDSWAARRLVDELRALECIRHPSLYLTTDQDRVIRLIDRHRHYTDPPAPEYLDRVIKQVKTLVTAEGLVKGTPEALAESAKESRSLDALLLLTKTILRRPPPARLRQRYQKSPGDHVSAASA